MTRGLVLVLTLLTGFTGLVYEVAWQKYLATLLGSHSEATAAVLGIFLGGLSVGYALFGRVSRRLAERSRGGSARSLTQSFTGYYEYSAPFDIDVLSDTWWRCTGDDRCDSVGSRYREMGASRSASAGRTGP